jgi:glucose/arabinose dehydrogenase
MFSRTPRTLLVIATAGSAVAASLLGAAPGLAAQPKVTISTVISGLNAPRGITFDGQGNLYVAESGSAGAGAAGLTRTGRVTKYVRGSSHVRWSKSFQSFYATEDPSAPPDALGPEGLSALRTGCRSWNGAGTRSAWASRCQVRMIMSESHDGIAAASSGTLDATQAGHLYRLTSATGHPTYLRNVGDKSYAWTNARKSLFPSDFPDSNPFGVLVVRDSAQHRVRTFVADAGANTIIEVMAKGRDRVVSYIPNETAAPFRDATPTCIAQGPDGMLYVATLHLVANLFVPGATGGKSDVWRVNPNAHYPQKPTLWATGLTTPTGCIFDSAGNFWATELFQPNAGGPPGDVVRIPFKHPRQLRRFGGGQLPMPGMITQGPGGAMFITTHSADPTPGAGQVVRLRINQ